jgi:hypothetical protein
LVLVKLAVDIRTRSGWETGALVWHGGGRIAAPIGAASLLDDKILRCKGGN